MNSPLGRTNQIYPPVWWKLVGTDELQIDPVRSELEMKPAPVMAGSFWSHALQDLEIPWLACGGRSIPGARSESEANDFLSADIVQLVSASPRGQLEVFFLSVDRAWEEHQINGGIAALESAREEGLIRFFGLHVAGPSIAVASMWRFHDAFELVLCSPQPERDFLAIKSTARERRVGLVQEGPGADQTPALISVSSVDEMREIRA